MGYIKSDDVDEDNSSLAANAAREDMTGCPKEEKSDEELAKEDDRSAVIRSVKLAAIGQLSRAAKALGRETMLDASDEEVKRKLKLLHPAQIVIPPTRPIEATHVSLISNPQLIRFIRRKFCRGLAAGSSG